MSRYDTDYSKMGFSTRAIKIGEGVDPVTKALNTPIYETSTYGYETAEQYDEMLARGAQWEPDIYIYSRTTNPTTNALEKKVMSLEGAEDALICSCGMAAISNALLSNLDTGDHVICSDDTFMCTSSMFADILPAEVHEMGCSYHDFVGIVELYPVNTDPLVMWILEQREFGCRLIKPVPSEII